MSLNDFVQIVTGTIGTIGFAILFNIRGKRLVACAFGGFLTCLLFALNNLIISNEAVNYFIVALVISLYAEIAARIFKTPTTSFITTSLIPLIPGSSLYYTMAYAFKSDGLVFSEKAIHTLQLASALALGIIVATTLTKIVCEMIEKGKQK